MGKHAAEWTLEHGWAEALAYAQAPRYGFCGDDREPDYLNQRLTRGRHAAMYPTGTAVGLFRNAEAWKKEKP